MTRLVFLVATLVGCGGGASYYGGSEQTRSTGGYRGAGGGGGEGNAPAADMAPEPVAMESAPGGPAPADDRAGVGWGAFENRREADEETAEREIYAQNTPQRQTRPPTPQQTPTPQQPQPHEQTANDASSGPLLIYEAILNLAVYQVEENQRAVVVVAQETGGFLARQDDTTIVIRVPADKFRDALARIEALGDVLHRNVQALDVSEEFRDVQIRLRNAEQVRDRLAQLLEQARNVEESLRIEHELERLTGEIESMKGRLRFLQDRIAFSTITVNFSPKEEESLEGEIFHLPFDWLYNLGLRTLLNLR